MHWDIPTWGRFLYRNLFMETFTVDCSIVTHCPWARCVAVQEIVLACFVQLVRVRVLWSAMAVVSTELVPRPAQPSSSLVHEIRTTPCSLQPLPPPPHWSCCSYSLSYNYGELYHQTHLFMDHTVHLSYPHLGYLNTQVGHADHNYMLFSAALNLSLLPTYHQYVINSNLWLKTNQVIFEMTIIRDLRKY